MCLACNIYIVFRLHFWSAHQQLSFIHTFVQYLDISMFSFPQASNHTCQIRDFNFLSNQSTFHYGKLHTYLTISELS